MEFNKRDHSRNSILNWLSLFSVLAMIKSVDEVSIIKIQSVVTFLHIDAY